MTRNRETGCFSSRWTRVKNGILMLSILSLCLAGTPMSAYLDLAAYAPSFPGRERSSVVSWEWLLWLVSRPSSFLESVNLAFDLPRKKNASCHYHLETI